MSEANRDDDVLVDADEGSARLKVSKATFWSQVANGYLPPPVYPAPRMPRWWWSELRDTINTRRRLPAAQKEIRRQERIAADAK